MPAALTAFFVFAAAAVAEIVGCFAFWAWLRQGKSILWLAPGIASLILFAYLLTLAPSSYAVRAYAAYGGIYIAASLLWLRLAECTPGHVGAEWRSDRDGSGSRRGTVWRLKSNPWYRRRRAALGNKQVVPAEAERDSCANT